MKIRLGFVSNSSSSSFTCLVCGHNKCGQDLGLEDAGMYHCCNGHIFCDSHLAKKDITIKEKRDELLRLNDEQDEEIAKMSDSEIEEEFEKLNKDDYVGGGTQRYETMKALCPICNLVSVPDDALVDYLLKKIGTTREKVLHEICEHYTNFEELAADCGRRKKI